MKNIMQINRPFFFAALLCAMVTVGLSAQNPLRGTTWYNPVGSVYSYDTNGNWTADQDGDGVADIKATYVVEGNIVRYTYTQLAADDPCPLSAKRAFRFTVAGNAMTLVPESDDCPERAKQWQPAGVPRTYHNGAYYEQRVIGSHPHTANGVSGTLEIRADKTYTIIRDGKTAVDGTWTAKGPIFREYVRRAAYPNFACKDDSAYLIKTDPAAAGGLFSVLCDFCAPRRMVFTATK